MIISRGNCGLCLIDLRKLKAYRITKKDDIVLSNLYGHGDVLQVYESREEENVVSIATLYQKSYG